MSERNSTPPAKPRKPRKPREDFPLGPHPSGYWCKKIRGTLHYFGPRWRDAAGAAAAAPLAEAEYDAQKDDLHAGRTPRQEPDGALTVKGLANAFLNAKETQRDSGELSARTFDDYNQACDRIVAAFGKGRLVADLGPGDFAALRAKAAKQWGVYRLGNFVQYVRTAFKFAYESGLIDRPVRFGPDFTKPSKKNVRVHRAQAGPKLFTADELRRMIGAAGAQLKAMLLLGINCGLGNSDVGNLPLAALDLDAGWLNYARPKTGIDRRCPLWPETVEALRQAIAKRPEPKAEGAAGLVFVTRCGESWAKGTTDQPVSKEARKLLNALGINGHRNFYTLRHTHRTVADEAKDQAAADHLMGHEAPNMATVYRERISDARLQAVTDHVRGWLFPPQQ
jgi:integrase